MKYKQFFIGFLVATVFWFWVLNEIEIPEYTIEHKTVCT